METLIKLNNQTAGRDKIARLIQYGCRALWDSLQPNQINMEIIDRLKAFEYILGSFRKLLRFGKCLDLFYASLKSVHHPNIALRLTLTLGKLSQALFLFADHIVWLSRSGLFKSLDLKKWVQTSNKYWFLSIVMNLCRDVYEIVKLLDTSRDVRNLAKTCTIKSRQDLLNLSIRTYACFYSHQDVFLDTLKNVCDLFIPMTSLGYTQLSPRTIGILGVISSIAAMIAIIKPNAKLVPS